jgi:hypothetical protein
VRIGVSGTILNAAPRGPLEENRSMSRKSYLGFAALTVVTAWPLAAFSQNPVRPTNELLEANALGVPIDPATRVDPATMPRDIGRRTLEPLGLTAEQLSTARTVTYSAEHLEDAAGALEVFYTSVVRDDGRWVFWGEDLGKETTRQGSEVQLTLATTNGARYLVDFVLDSAEQQFAVVSGDTRTTQAPELGHLALIVTGTGKDHKVRLLPLGDASYKSRRFTLFQVRVTPLL